jgi:hypothetical protein
MLPCQTIVINVYARLYHRLPFNMLLGGIFAFTFLVTLVIICPQGGVTQHYSEILPSGCG